MALKSIGLYRSLGTSYVTSSKLIAVQLFEISFEKQCLDRQTDRQAVGGQAGGQTDGWTEGQTDGWQDRWAGRQAGRQTAFVFKKATRQTTLYKWLR